MSDLVAYQGPITNLVENTLEDRLAFTTAYAEEVNDFIGLDLFSPDYDPQNRDDVDKIVIHEPTGAGIARRDTMPSLPDDITTEAELMRYIKNLGAPWEEDAHSKVKVKINPL